jgi:hypothetical protein
MVNQSSSYDEWEYDFAVDYREDQAADSERVFLAGCERSGQERFASELRHRRRGGNSAGGMHRRGTRRRSA